MHFPEQIEANPLGAQELTGPRSGEGPAVFAALPAAYHGCFQTPPSKSAPRSARVHPSAPFDLATVGSQSWPLAPELGLFRQLHPSRAPSDPAPPAPTPGPRPEIGFVPSSSPERSNPTPLRRLRLLAPDIGFVSSTSSERPFRPGPRRFPLPAPGSKLGSFRQLYPISAPSTRPPSEAIPLNLLHHAAC